MVATSSNYLNCCVIFEQDKQLQTFFISFRVPIWPVMQYSGYSTMDPYATVYNLEMFRQRSAAFIEEMLPQRSAGAVTTSVTNMCLLNKERVDEISSKS